MPTLQDPLYTGYRARRRARAGGRDMRLADLLPEIGGTEERSPEDRWIAAIHEAGHAVAVYALRSGRINAVSLQSSAGIVGTTAVRVAASDFLRAADLQERLVMVLAGRAAEAVVFGMPSSGAGGPEDSDLVLATHLVVISLAALGLDEVAGLVWHGWPEINAIPDWLAAHPALAARVRTVLDETYAAACDLINARITAVTVLAQALLAKRILNGHEDEAIIRHHSGQLGHTP